ncbi:hypothetical protein [Nodosilinea sp. P-1105]|uniref:hypothetical protein n=1 Tax=Nodosilinea sp. P-1105 TaxID=2546229 RepID=UPI00146EA1DF|nr:hypothetical protein [Nodosilinea sp. P-1105]NMF85029.1 hypothetical protein [Nodosilinea sp. P-1105]
MRCGSHAPATGDRRLETAIALPFQSPCHLVVFWVGVTPLTASYRFCPPGLSDSDSLGGLGRHRALNGTVALAARETTPRRATLPNRSDTTPSVAGLSASKLHPVSGLTIGDQQNTPGNRQGLM